MRNLWRFLFALLVVAAVLCVPAWGATKPFLTVSPEVVSTPVPEGGLRVCATGFAKGDLVVIAIPFSGSPDKHTVLVYQWYALSPAKDCTYAPPSGFNLALEVGKYEVRSFYAPVSRPYKIKSGPTGELIVMR